MIQDNRTIQIDAPIQVVFDLIDIMPKKFPIYKILESKPFFVIRCLFSFGFRSAWEAVKLERPKTVLKLDVGDAMGPFTLIQLDKPNRYYFSLNSLFFNCQTGYSLISNNGGTQLSFDIIAENPTLKGKIFWYLFKPFHILFMNKVLHVIKEKINKSQ